MNEEEAKTVEELKNCCLFWEGQYISSDKEEDRKMAEKEIAINRTLLNLLEKKDKEIENWKMEYNHWCQLAIDRKKEIEKKDKIIDEMTKWLHEELKGVNTPEKIKQYFERKVENGN